MLTKLKAYLKNEDGATAIEYGLIAAGIGLAISVVVFLLGDDLVAMFESMGFRREGLTIQSFCNKGVWRDEYLYAVLSSEWKQ